MLLAALIVTGCGNSAPSARAFSQLRLPQTSRDTAYELLAETLAARYPIASADRGAGAINTEPVETREANNQGRVGDLMGVRRRIRRTVNGRVTGNDTSAEVWCKVVVERYDPNASALFRNEMRMVDAPINTAADNEAATTTEQNEVWRTVRRDKRLERELLGLVGRTATGETTP